MTIQSTRIPHAAIQDGVFLRSRKNPAFVRLVVGLLNGDALYCDTFGSGACEIYTLRGWGIIEDNPPEAEAIMGKVAQYGGLDAMREKAGIPPIGSPTCH